MFSTRQKRPGGPPASRLRTKMANPLLSASNMSMASSSSVLGGTSSTAAPAGTGGVSPLTRMETALPKHYQGFAPSGALLRREAERGDPLANFQQTTAVLYPGAGATDVVVIESSGLSHNYAELRINASISWRQMTFPSSHKDDIPLLAALPGGEIHYFPDVRDTAAEPSSCLLPIPSTASVTDLVTTRDEVFAVVTTGDLYAITPTSDGRVTGSRIAKANEASMLAGFSRRMTNLFGFSDTTRELHVRAALPLTGAPSPVVAVVMPQSVELWTVTDRRLLDVDAIQVLDEDGVATGPFAHDLLPARLTLATAAIVAESPTHAELAVLVAAAPDVQPVSFFLCRFRAVHAEGGRVEDIVWCKLPMDEQYANGNLERHLSKRLFAPGHNALVVVDEAKHKVMQVEVSDEWDSSSLDLIRVSDNVQLPVRPAGMHANGAVVCVSHIRSWAVRSIQAFTAAEESVNVSVHNRSAAPAPSTAAATANTTAAVPATASSLRQAVAAYLRTGDVVPFAAQPEDALQLSEEILDGAAFDPRWGERKEQQSAFDGRIIGAQLQRKTEQHVALLSYLAHPNVAIWQDLSSETQALLNDHHEFLRIAAVIRDIHMAREVDVERLVLHPSRIDSDAFYTQVTRLPLDALKSLSRASLTDSTATGSAGPLAALALATRCCEAAVESRRTRADRYTAPALAAAWSSQPETRAIFRKLFDMHVAVYDRDPSRVVEYMRFFAEMVLTGLQYHADVMGDRTELETTCAELAETLAERDAYQGIELSEQFKCYAVVVRLCHLHDCERVLERILSRADAATARTINEETSKFYVTNRQYHSRLLQSTIDSEVIGRTLKGEPSLQWLHFIDSKEYEGATSNLLELAGKEHHARKEKLLLSLATLTNAASRQERDLSAYDARMETLDLLQQLPTDVREQHECTTKACTLTTLLQMYNEVLSRDLMEEEVVDIAANACRAAGLIARLLAAADEGSLSAQDEALLPEAQIGHAASAATAALDRLADQSQASEKDRELRLRGSLLFEALQHCQPSVLDALEQFPGIDQHEDVAFVFALLRRK